MPTEEFTPDLSSLDDEYQILTELRRSANSLAFLARNLKLNRDVTITVVRVPAGGDRNTLSLFAADARALTAMRHPNVVPVIEGRWLKDGSFAIVRARVRGSTLDQVIGAAGAMPAARVASTLEQVHAALEWSRANGIAHRHVDADAIVFQQGSGRVLLELDPSPLIAGGVPETCDDARTIGRLAYEMLSGQREGDPAARPLAVARPDLRPEVARETEALMRCDRAGSPRDAAALITLLGGTVGAAPAVAPAHARADSSDAAVVVVQRGASFNARLISAIAVVAIIAVLGILLLNRRGPTQKLTASGVGDTAGQSAGEVALPRPSPDTFPIVTPTIVTPAPTSPATPAAPLLPPQTQATVPVVPPVQDSLMTLPPQLPAIRRPAPPETRRPEPPRGNPPSTLPPIAVPTPRDSAARGDICDSSDPGDQHTCLITAIENNDRELNSTYQRLVAALRRQAGAREGDPDPASVDDLRAAQRRWLDSRDAACRDVGSGTIYARARAQCFAEQSSARTRELADRLSAIPPEIPRDRFEMLP